MARVIPFRGIRFDPAKVGDVGRVISPPYDVISDQEREELFARSPCNIARIIRADSSDGYAGAAATARRWRSEGVLRADERPSLYVYEQSFEVDGLQRRRTGLIGLVRLDETGREVMPHERTLDGPKADRLKLLRATQTTFGQVFALFRDPSGAADAACEAGKASAPLADAEDGAGLRHRLWAITDGAAIGRVRSALAPLRLLIADGHHRYATAVNFLRERPDLPAARWGMMTLANMASPGLVILPIHRLVRSVPGYEEAALLRRLEEDFELRRFESGASLWAEMQRARAAGRHAFGLFTGDGAHRAAVLRGEDRLDALADAHPVLRRLDVTILHKLILERLLGIDAERLAAGAHVEYVKGADGLASAERVRAGEFQAAFLLNPTRVDEVEAVALAGECMPQKSTFFYPKVYTGVVMQDLLAEPVEA